MLLKNRRVSHLDATPNELEEAFKAISSSFGEVWLTSKSAEHRLQQLWQRKDGLATSELFTFGSALATLKAANSDWLSKQIKKIRQPDKNNQNGAIFEILGLAMLASAGMAVIPAKDNQKGFDATIKFADTRLGRISIKNHQMSAHEEGFRRDSKKLHAKALAAFRTKLRSVQIVAFFKDYPTSKDWDVVWQAISAMARTQKIGTTNPADNILLDIKQLPDNEKDGSQLSANHFSNRFVTMGALHKNEQANFISKLNGAAHNMKKHAGRDADILNMLFIRLHATAPIDALEKAASELFIEGNDPGVDIVYLHQAYVARHSEDTNYSSIIHTVRAVSSPYTNMEDRKINRTYAKVSRILVCYQSIIEMFPNRYKYISHNCYS